MIIIRSTQVTRLFPQDDVFESGGIWHISWMKSLESLSSDKWLPSNLIQMFLDILAHVKQPGGCLYTKNACLAMT